MIASPYSIRALCCDSETATQLLKFQFPLLKNRNTDWDGDAFLHCEDSL